MLTCVAMFIGACPGSCAGGIETTTVAVLFAGLRSELEGRPAYLLDRAVPPAMIRKAIGVAFTSFGLVAVFIFLLLRRVDSIGAREVDVAVVTAVSRHLLDYATHFRVVPWSASPAYVGKALSQADFKRYELNVIAWFGADAQQPRLNFPTADYQIEAGHTLLLVGEQDAIERFLAHAQD